MASGAVGVLLATTACASAEKPSAMPPMDHANSSSTGTVVNATFAKDKIAFNYDKKLVPDGARVLVAENIQDNATTVTLSVHGLLPNRTYGAHVHANPCGPNGEDAGAHFQHMADPVKPSVNPEFANSGNEIWLDFTTDAQGNATVARTVEWKFTDARAGSVVIHANPTQTAEGKAGTAGARAACVSVSF
jgi:Cu-Zn family superoxide dismutase